MLFFFGFCSFFGGSINDACDLETYFCFFSGGGGGELGDGGEARVDGYPRDNGEGECSGAAREDGGGGGEPGAGCRDASLDP